MNKDLPIPEKIKESKFQEYFVHLREVIERQNKQIQLNTKVIQILRIDYHQDINQLLNELLFQFSDDQYSSIRIIIKNQGPLNKGWAIKTGIGKNKEAYAYLDDQVEDLLGKPGILYISDTTKIHSIKFVSGNQFPKTILGISLESESDKLGMIWFSCENQKTFSKFESDSLVDLVGACTIVIQKCIEWNENQIHISFRNEILDTLHFPIFILSKDAILFSNSFANQTFNAQHQDNEEKEELLKKIWNIQPENENQITLNDKKYEVDIIESTQKNRESLKAVVLIDETLSQQQREYITLFIATLSQGLRSPLNLILGSIKMLPLVGDVDEHQQNYIKSIQQKTEDTLKIVEELLDFERIVKNNGLKIEAVNSEILLNTSISLVNHLANQKRISIIRKTSNLDGLIKIDKVLFTQAIANILEYAIGQTGLGGEITLTLESHAEKWQLIINDNSSGISQVEVDRLNSFENLHEIPKGVLLVRSIIISHRGTFMINSELGIGNTYIIEIPKVL